MTLKFKNNKAALVCDPDELHDILEGSINFREWSTNYIKAEPASDVSDKLNIIVHQQTLEKSKQLIQQITENFTWTDFHRMRAKRNEL